MKISTVDLRTPNGRRVAFQVRDGTNDGGVAYTLTIGDEYRMKDRRVDGWVLDVGAHIGAFAIPVALDHPLARVIAIEAVPENCDLIEANARMNGVSVIVVRAAAARPGVATAPCHWGYRHHASVDDGYIAAHRFVGNTWVDQGEPEFGGEIPAISLDALTERYDIPEIDLLKIDCEGCEWAFLDSPMIGKVREITGEFHGGYTDDPGYVPDPASRIHELLDATHEVRITRPDPSVGLFEATRR